MTARAIIRRPRRKAHIASLAADGLRWATLCDRWVVADGATEQDNDAHLCAECDHAARVAREFVTEQHIDELHRSIDALEAQVRTLTLRLIDRVTA